MVKISTIILLLLSAINVYSEEPLAIKNLSQMSVRSSPIDIDIFELEDKKQLETNSIYNQVMTCYAKPFGNKHGRSTNVHETVHGINNTISNTKTGYRAFYAGCCRCVWLKEPNLKMEDITPYIPDVLKGYRYTLYFVSQLRYWNDAPLYPVDEWSAYISGAECAVDDYSNNMLTEKNRSDSVSGALEFSIYCTALAKAVKSKDLKYWDTYPQFKNTIKFLLVKSEKVFFEGRSLFPSERQEILLKNLQTSKKAKPIRDFLVNEFDGVFIK